MNFITPEDLSVTIRDRKLQMILDQDNSILDDAEKLAIATVQSSLAPKYDLDIIFNTTGDDRSLVLVRYIINLMTYYIYERIPDKLVPERVIKNYNDTTKSLLAIEDGKKNMILPHKTKTDGSLQTKFRWGSEKPRGF